MAGPEVEESVAEDVLRAFLCGNGVGVCDLESIGQCGKHQQELQRIEEEDESKQLWSLLQPQIFVF